ncbi:HAD family phosphatase [Caenimonas sedimenti]|uniref:HAD family phosphatase n=1 Tax=Caenimonas sedimenti TaxID=2596921 RepID=A0A562ZQ25_9BURK|nr:HAD family phosphatase [Caenimonas sedimenti]TWO70679.1 HAD family phosphatase [Caenimonas sedimenti]
MAAPVAALLFDIGNVVIDVDFARTLTAWQKSSALSLAELKARFGMDEPYRQHEVGVLATPQYFAHLRGQLRLDCDDATVLAGWNATFGAPVAGTLALIDQVRERVPCFAFSNTNKLHMDEMQKNFADVLQRFEHVFASHEIGHRKPQAAAFRYVLEKIGRPAEQVLFFDDLAENVEGAAACGLQAVLFREPEDVRRELAARGLLAP